ncbi:MAG: hypothetical protein ACLPIX_12750, partial [Rhodomicrobium sp.]
MIEYGKTHLHSRNSFHSWAAVGNRSLLPLRSEGIELFLITIAFPASGRINHILYDRGITVNSPITGSTATAISFEFTDSVWASTLFSTALARPPAAQSGKMNGTMIHAALAIPAVLFKAKPSASEPPRATALPGARL